MGELKRGIVRSKLEEFESCKQKHDEAQGLIDEGKLAQADKLLRESVEWSLKNLGEDHEKTVYYQETLAYILNERGHYANMVRGKNDEAGKLKIKVLFEEARDLDTKVLEIRSRVEDKSAPSKDFLETQRNLAKDYSNLEEYGKAAGLFLENYEARRKHSDFGEDHESTLRAGDELAGCWHRQNRFLKAKALNEKILEARIRLKKPEAAIEKSRNALYWNKLMIGEREKNKDQSKEKSEGKKDDSGKESSKNKTNNQGEERLKAEKMQDVNGGDDNLVKQAGSPPIPNIIFKYVDPRASGIDQADSDSSSVVSGSTVSNQTNLPFRRGSGRPPSPLIIDVERGQRRDKPKSKSPGSTPTKPSEASENLKPMDNNTGKNIGPNRARSLSNNKDKAKVKAPTRAKSTSPAAVERKLYRQLSDAGPGNDDEISARQVETWFYSLQSETQALLEPLRRERGKRVKIAILDTGIDIGHPYFAEDQAKEPNRRRIKNCENFLEGEKDAQDICGHGTHSVGILRKVAPEADIYVARVAKDFDHDLSPAAVEKAIYRACRDKKDENGVKNWNVDVITMSFGFYQRSKAVQKAIQEALAKPVLVFAAASNDGTMKEVTFPAWLGGVICVNSATASGTPSLFNPDSKAPSNFSILGEDVKSAWIRSPGNPNAEKVMSGTSVATPIAAGVAALVLEFVMQNDPESVLMEQLEDLKHQDGMPEVFAQMVRSDGKYRNVVPWALLSATNGRSRRMVTSFIEHALRNFRGV